MPPLLPPDAELWAVDADAFVVRPGPRVTEGVETFAAILHPDRIGPARARHDPADCAFRTRIRVRTCAPGFAGRIDQRIVRKAARTSSTKTSGCSNAAKCPPFGGSFQ